MILSVMTMILLPTALLLLTLVFITLNRYIRYRERVALAQLGYPPEDLSLQDASISRGSRGVLWGGVITATSGLALLLGLGTLGIGVWLIAGFLPLFVGLGMILIYFLAPGSTPREEEASTDFAMGLGSATDEEREPADSMQEVSLSLEGLDEEPWAEDVKPAVGDGLTLPMRSGQEPTR